MKLPAARSFRARLDFRDDLGATSVEPLTLLLNFIFILNLLDSQMLNSIVQINALHFGAFAAVVMDQ